MHLKAEKHMPWNNGKLKLLYHNEQEAKEKCEFILGMVQKMYSGIVCD